MFIILFSQIVYKENNNKNINKTKIVTILKLKRILMPTRFFTQKHSRYNSEHCYNQLIFRNFFL